MTEKERKEKISDWRWRIVKAGMTRNEFSVYAGIQAANLSRYINLKTKPSDLSFQKIESALEKLKV